jgi:hypothetical protein
MLFLKFFELIADQKNPKNSAKIQIFAIMRMCIIWGAKVFKSGFMRICCRGILALCACANPSAVTVKATNKKYFPFKIKKDKLNV